MKYIDVERLKVIIKQAIRREELNFAALGSGGQTFCINTLEWVLTKIDSLQQEQPSLPVLDEAAEEYMKKARKHLFDDSPIGRTDDAFKAGAEWQKEQMLKDAVEGDYDCQYATPAVFLDKYLDGIKDGDKVRIIIVKEEKK